MANIPPQQCVYLRWVGAVVAVRPMAAQKWRIDSKRISRGQEGSI